MSKLLWHQIGERIYETGVERGVLYKKDVTNGTYPLGTAWNGLINVSESPSGAESNPIYADNVEYLNLKSDEKFAGTIEAYTYPNEWASCDGSDEVVDGVYVTQQTRDTFGLSYRTMLGNDVKGTSFGYKIHLVYGGDAGPSEKGYSTINDTPEAMTMSWDFDTTAVTVTGKKPTAHLVIDSTKVDATKLAALEAILYGTDASGTGEATVEATVARLPLPDEVIALCSATE